MNTLNQEALIGTAILFSVSLLVRIIPAFFSFQLSPKVEASLKNHLPIAIFVNLLVYCLGSELEDIRLWFPILCGFVLLFLLRQLQKISYLSFFNSLLVKVVLASLLVLGVESFM